mmetsp:Transcript_1487/g.3204  ORF Transcript_1487/g.3204 Transcript_1487/m.3204 type:complete len:162 (+) Transcript_1487:69-554(+)|eukprot:CAMPEP_0173392342 /NCGR_PEP_ID=MMETSP1356-20130122/19198_1 /TAXON_ID=77927 ORGANISM="Hemiselmis virescens, Strain PCC157" /NCGR_SAMPLE_ID=MMETSP1356 /ASSEMBLY_ACC=CAM_ASM_000847 /LENGTH=161 /DNA_ID=CAMNT_0014350103 /DNA_START=62 /DNA_END=547 /DNA_ORIENTATION=+
MATNDTFAGGDKGIRELVQGCTAEVQGLVGAPQHNGTQGELLHFDRDKGRWGVKLAGSGEVLGVKPINLVYIKGPEGIADEEDDEGLGVMKRRFDRIVKKYQLFSEDKAGEIADLLTGKVTTPKEFAEKYGMLESEANSFLAWIQQGVEFKEKTAKNADAL